METYRACEQRKPCRRVSAPALEGPDTHMGAQQAHTYTRMYTRAYRHTPVFLRLLPVLPLHQLVQVLWPCDYQALGIRTPHGTLAETLVCVTVWAVG